MTDLAGLPFPLTGPAFRTRHAYFELDPTSEDVIVVQNRTERLAMLHAGGRAKVNLCVPNFAS